MQTYIERKWLPENRSYWFTTTSFRLGSEWVNCLYINFMKDEFPWLRPAKLVESNLLTNSKVFDYGNCSVAELSWHCGMTFYEEVMILRTNKILVKAGADYQHLYDDFYRKSDCGELILKNDAPIIMRGFDQMNAMLSQGKGGHE